MNLQGSLPDAQTHAPAVLRAPGWSYQLLLVSVVIINWNYARFVGAAIASVKRQDYPKFECLVVDNASTDNSVEVITEAIDGDDRFRLLRLPKNYGHFGATLKVLKQLNGHFVNFLDADDVLFDNFLSTHIQVHLVTASPVSFTSSNIITIDANGEVLAGRVAVELHGDERLRKCLPKVRDPLLPMMSDADYRLSAQRYLGRAAGNWLLVLVAGLVERYPAGAARRPCLRHYLVKLFGERTVIREFGALTNPKHLLEIVSGRTADSAFDVAVFSDANVRTALAKAYPIMVEMFGRRTIIRELLSLMKTTQATVIIKDAYRGRLRFADLYRLCTGRFRKLARAP